MEVGDLPGYRLVLQGQYDERFRDHRPDEQAARRAALRPYLDRVLAALNLPDAGAHLDLGCGAGLAALAVAHARPAVRVVGVDLSPRAVHLAREAARVEALANAAFAEGDAEDPPAGPFDRATALSVFNLMPDKGAALRAWRRAVPPGGRLVLTDAFALAGAGTPGAGAATEAAFVALGRRAGWRLVHKEDLTRLVARLHRAKAWPWPEYVRAGYAYRLVALE